MITLTTDFGLKDPYVAEIKAVILSLNPNAVIVDVTHQIEKYNIRMAAYVLASAAPYFPNGTIHVAIVDPGVGTRRRPIIVQTKHAFFVGPDNGILTLAAENQEIQQIHEIANSHLILQRVSNTFHGRDIFAPAAAHLACGVKPEEFGPELRQAVKPEFAKVTRRKGALTGEVLHVDDFGNVITNINAKELSYIQVEEKVNVELPRCTLRLKLGKAYAETKPNEPLAIIGSHDYLEIAVNQGNAALKFKTKPGDKITISPA